MKKTVSEILDTDKFNFFINLAEVSFFVDKPKNQSTITNRIQEELSKSYQNMLNGIISSKDELAKPSEILQEQNNEIAIRDEEIARRNEEISEELESLDGGNQLGRKYELIEEQYSLLEEHYSLIEKSEKIRIAAEREGKKIDLVLNNRDSYVTFENTNIIRKVLKENFGLVNRDKLLLYYGMLAKKYLNWIIEAENGTHTGYNEFCFGTGEIVTINGNEISMQLHESIKELKSDLAEAILIANQELQSKTKNTQFSISGIYAGRGSYETRKSGTFNKKEQFSTKDLSELAKSKMVLSNIEPKKIEEYISNGLVNKWNLLKLMNKGELDINFGIELFEKGILKQDELLKKVFNVNNFSEVLKNNKVSLKSKLLLYSMEKIRIDELEKAVKPNLENEELIPKEFFTEISKYYFKNINKISELLTHDVLDFNQSMQFLDELRTTYRISDEDREYLVDIMNDFKTKQLLNQTENEKAVRGERDHIVPPVSNLKGVTIDPTVRREYLKSIGNVKDIFIKGQALMQDDSARNKDGSSKRNSLDGYQLIVIPDKKVAILEKFYEVTRNKDGNVVYRKDENGKLIPAVENATYIIPIGLAKDFSEKKNKQELINSQYVRRVSHTMNWVKNIESKIKVLNPKAEFEKENTDKWNKKVTDNYKELLENR